MNINVMDYRIAMTQVMNYLFYVQGWVGPDPVQKAYIVALMVLVYPAVLIVNIILCG